MQLETGDTIVLAGTRKGLFALTSRDRRDWRVQPIGFDGLDVHHAALDPRNPRVVMAAVSSQHWGPSVQRRDLAGSGDWEPVSITYPKESGLTVSRVWHVAPGHAADEWWAGVEPAGLFHSTDGGRTWQDVGALTKWEGRSEWFPGGGGLCMHTILPHPRDGNRLVAAASAVGIFDTRDGGKSWRLANGGIRNEIVPEKVTREDQHGTCPHKLVRDAKDPDTLYMQNHWGVYRRAATDAKWTAIDEGLPSQFGFPLASHPREAGTLYTVPLTGDFNRVSLNGAFAVHRTRDAGKTWERLAKGLPQQNAWLTVLREGLAVDTHDDAGVYVGTTGGQLFASRDAGDSWSAIATTLPPIMSVTAAVVK